MIALVRFVMASSNPGRVHGVGAFINIDKHRLCAAISDRLGGRHECAGNGNHFVSRTDPQRKKRQPKRVRAAPDADGVPAIAVCGEILFKSLDEGPAGECPAVDHFFDRGTEFATKRRVLGIEVKKWNFHWYIY